MLWVADAHEEDINLTLLENLIIFGFLALHQLLTNLLLKVPVPMLK